MSGSAIDFLDEPWLRVTDPFDFDFGSIRGLTMHEAVSVLKSAGYTGLPISTELGGGGRRLDSCCHAQMKIAENNASLAVALNMHLFSVDVMNVFWVRRRDFSWAVLEAIATQGRIMSSAFAEVGLDGDIFQPGTSAVERPDGGFVVSGVKDPCSLASMADLFCINAVNPANGELVLALVPAGATGLEIEARKPTIALASATAERVRLSNVEVPPTLTFVSTSPDEVTAVLLEGSARFAAMTTAVYLGIARAALAGAMTLVEGAAVSRRERVIASLTRPFAALATHEAALRDLCTHLDRGDASGAGSHDARAMYARAAALRLETGEVLPHHINRVAAAVGGPALSTSTPFGAARLDLLAIGVHPPTPHHAEAELRHVMVVDE